MYVTLLTLVFEVSENPLIFLGLVVLLLASWALIVSAIYDIAVRLFDVPGGE